MGSDAENARIDSLIFGLQRNLDDFRDSVDKRLEKQERLAEKQADSAEKRDEELKKSIEALRDTVSSGPIALTNRVSLVEEKTAMVTRIMGFMATATVTTALTVIGAIIATAMHWK
jgi:5-formaminoimidazole-4-carboxamide-1-beta-D-ribofuranosyl 5'-monophosphate synthetase